jgi:tripartite-type tricarboxylate transporter receptor subunit TctC
MSNADIQRRHLLQLGAACAAWAVAPGSLAQAKYPERPITLVDCFTAGGSSDIFARYLAEQMGPILGGTVVVENKPGSGGGLGTEFVARAAPDGYTLAMATVSTMATGPAVNPKLRYDPLKDFAHITNVLTVPSVLVVHPSVPAKTLKELIKLSTVQPGTLTFGTPGMGSAGHILLEQFMQLSGARFNHIPYRGSGGAINDLLGAQILVASDNLPSMLPHIQAGKVRAIAVRDTKRLDQLPNVPTYAEEGYEEVSAPLWFGLVAPAGTPKDIINRLNQAAHKAIATPEFQARLRAVSATSAANKPEQFAAQAREMFEKYKGVVKAGNITIG